MTAKPIRFLSLLTFCLAAACGADAPRNAAGEDVVLTIYTGGVIYTGVDDAPTAEAVAVLENGGVTAVGARAPLEDIGGRHAVIVDLQGAVMYPGFVDAHAHLLGVGMRELILNLEGINSIAALVAVVAAAVEDARDGAVVYGRGWIETGWPEGRMPNRTDLDAVSPDQPVILFRADGHAAVVNTAALEAAGVDDATPDPAGGRIERDGAGRATGLLIDNAMGLVRPLLAAPSAEKKREAYAKASDVYTAYGWTGMHNMSVDPADLPMMETLADEGALALRVYNSVNTPGLDALERNGPRANADGRIVTRAMKLYVDGALGSRGAALSAPYTDQLNTRGLLLMEKGEALALFQRAINAGVQVNTHAIGDRGNKLVLNWYEEIFKANPGADDLRWRIEHAQILHTEDIPRFAELGVIPSMQPSHAIGDLFFAPARLGPDRLDGAYAWRALIDAGAVIAGGSDAPVERGDPMIEFYAAVARRGLDGTQTEDWRPDQATTRAEALKMFTLWPAYAAFQEDRLGTIEAGKRADFTVLSADIMQIPAEEILNVQAVMTVVDGKIVHDARSVQTEDR